MYFMISFKTLSSKMIFYKIFLVVLNHMIYDLKKNFNQKKYYLYLQLTMIIIIRERYYEVYKNY